MKQRQKVYTGFLIIDSEDELEYIQEIYGIWTLKRLDSIFKMLFDEDNNFKLMKDLLAEALFKCNIKIEWHEAYPELEKIAKTLKVRIHDRRKTVFWSNLFLMTTNIDYIRNSIVGVFINYINQ